MQSLLLANLFIPHKKSVSDTFKLISFYAVLPQILSTVLHDNTELKQTQTYTKLKSHDFKR